MRILIRITEMDDVTEVSRELGIQREDIEISNMAGDLDIQQIYERPDLGQLVHKMAEAAVRVHRQTGLDS